MDLHLPSRLTSGVPRKGLTSKVFEYVVEAVGDGLSGQLFGEGQAGSGLFEKRDGVGHE